MIKEAIEKIVSLATPQTYEIEGKTYASDSLHRIDPKIDRPDAVSFSSLDGIVKAIRTEITRSEITKPIFVNIYKHDKIEVFTTLRYDNQKRDTLYTATPELPDRPQEWNSYDDAMIILRSRFIENEGTAYIIELLSSVTDDNSVQSSDNGLTQTVNVKQGISLARKSTIRPQVVLKPFRTFLEVDQPESEFLLRLRPGDEHKEAKVGLFEADGGAWKLQAKRNVSDYLCEALADLVEAGDVVVAK